jgi:hypothetical protein
MKKIEKRLIVKAIKKYQKIFPVSNKPSFLQCFSQFGQMYYFWFNTEDNNTHVVARKIHTE